MSTKPKFKKKKNIRFTEKKGRLNNINRPNIIKILLLVKIILNECA